MPKNRLLNTLKWFFVGLIIGATVVFGQAQAAPPTVSFSANPTSGAAPLSTTLTWSSSGALSCTASGGWSGNKAVSGSQLITGIAGTTTFSLTCSNGLTQSTQISWIPPTKNTDGSNLTDLAGYDLFRSTTSETVASATPINVSASASSFTFTGLSPGTHYFALKAYNQFGTRSALSSIANKTLSGESTIKDVTVTVNTVPEPPTVVTVQTTVVEMRMGNKIWVVKAIGTLPLGTPCGRLLKVVSGADYYEVPYDSKWKSIASNSVAAARCAPV